MIFCFVFESLCLLKRKGPKRSMQHKLWFDYYSKISVLFFSLFFVLVFVCLFLSVNQFRQIS